MTNIVLALWEFPLYGWIGGKFQALDPWMDTSMFCSHRLMSDTGINYPVTGFDLYAGAHAAGEPD
jgi:hypothetical protein